MPQYRGAARTLLAQGVCQAHAGQLADAEASLARSYELDPTSPFTATNLAEVLYRRGDYERARFYIRRVNAHARESPTRRRSGSRHASRPRWATARARRSSARSCATASRSRPRLRCSRAGHSMSEVADAAAPSAGRAAARGARAPGAAHRRPRGVDQGDAEEARAARGGPLRRAARRDLHACPGANGVPRPQDRSGSGARAAAAACGTSARARQRGLERAVSRTSRRARATRQRAADARSCVLGDRGDPRRLARSRICLPSGWLAKRRLARPWRDVERRGRAAREHGAERFGVAARHARRACQAPNRRRRARDGADARAPSRSPPGAEPLPASAEQVVPGDERNPTAAEPVPLATPARAASTSG